MTKLERPEFWCDQPDDSDLETIFVYEIEFGHMVDDDHEISTQCTLAFNFDSAYSWAKDFIKSTYRPDSAPSILSIRQTGQAVDCRRTQRVPDAGDSGENN